MNHSPPKNPTAPASDEDLRLRQLGYQPELARRMSAFSNVAISLSIICILAGGISAFLVVLWFSSETRRFPGPPKLRQFTIS